MRLLSLFVAAAVTLATPAASQTPVVPNPVFLTAAPVEIPDDVVGEDGWLFKVVFKHAITARLNNRIVNPEPFASDALEPGDYLYGIPMAGHLGVGITWCAPRRGTCLTPGPRGYSWVAGGGMYTDSLRYPGTPPLADPQPEIERMPMALEATPSLEYRIIEWDRDDLDVRVYAHTGARWPRLVGDFNAPREADGTVLIRGMGGVIRISQVGADRHAARVEVIEPTEADQPILAPLPR